MSNVILKAIKDWCNGKFQSKGEYLTAEDLEEFHPGGVKLGVDENGNPGYYKYDESAGADTLVPFKYEKGTEFWDLRGLHWSHTSYPPASSDTYICYNKGKLKKIKVIGNLKGWVRSSGSKVNVRFGFKGYLKDGEGNRLIDQKEVSIASLINIAYSDGKQTVDFEKEIDISDVWFPNSDETDYAPCFSIYVSGLYGAGSIDADLIYCND